ATDLLVETDPVLLERLVRNLVDNAFKYTAAGNVTLAAGMHERVARIVVRDTGVGIPAAERERIFEEFYQIGNPERDRVQGLGLGLAIVQRLAQLLGLTLTLESEPGRGSTFPVAGPRATARRAPRRGPAPRDGAAPGALDGARILVIDDESEVRAGMRALLEQLGCRVSVCSGYADAERLLEQDGLEDVHLIVSDFRLRAHESGIDTVRRLRERLGEVPALLVSGDTAPERLREAQASGLPLLHKPVSADDLTEAILAALRRKPRLPARTSVQAFPDFRPIPTPRPRAQNSSAFLRTGGTHGSDGSAFLALVLAGSRTPLGGARRVRRGRRWRRWRRSARRHAR